jgi:hypothetical protein
MPAITTRRVAAIAVLALLLAAAYVWLAIWADERNQRFFLASEERPDWAR